MRHILIIFSIFLFSFTVISCAKKSSTEDTTTDYSTTDVTYSGIWIKDNSTSWIAFTDSTFDEFSTININYSSYRIIDFEAVNVGNEIKYSKDKLLVSWSLEVSSGTERQSISCE